MDPTSTPTEPVRTTNLDRSFWFEIEELGDVLDKLEGILKMAEANTVSLSKVFSRWESLYRHGDSVTWWGYNLSKP